MRCDAAAYCCRVLLLSFLLSPIDATQCFCVVLPPVDADFVAITPPSCLYDREEKFCAYSPELVGFQSSLQRQISLGGVPDEVA